MNSILSPLFSKAAGGAALLLASATTSPAQENWSGYEGGNLHRNASSVTVFPTNLAVEWIAKFDQPVSGTNFAFGSRNLVTFDGYTALVAKANGIPAVNQQEYVTVLNGAGAVANVVKVDLKPGAGSNFYPPTGIYIDSHDVGKGFQLTAWDPSNGILYLKSGGDNGSSIAYKPLANRASFSGAAQDGVKAFPTTAEWVPNSTSRRNESSFFELDPETNLIFSSDAYHFTSADTRSFKFHDKNTGQNLSGTIPAAFADTFAYWNGCMVANGAIYLMGPGQDNDNSGKLGDVRFAGSAFRAGTPNPRDPAFETGTNYNMQTPDQGLRLRALSYSISGSTITFDSTPVFDLTFASTHPVTPNGGPNEAESYWETDALFRNKAWLVDGDAVWAAWKPSTADPVQLIRADAAGSSLHNLGIGAGMPGHVIYPHISLGEVGGVKYLAYYAGNAVHRDYLDIIGSNGHYWGTPGSFSDRKPPKGNAQLAILNAATGAVTPYDLTALAPSLPANEFFFQWDKSHLVIAGAYAYVGWLDLSGETAALKLAAFDLANPGSPVVKTFPLGFNSTTYDRSFLTDLIAADGRIQALVTQSDVLDDDIVDWRWQAQHVVTLSNPTSTLEVSPPKVEIATPGESRQIAVEATVPWSASQTADWFEISPTSGTGSAQIEVTLLNRLGVSAPITFTSGLLTRTVEVSIPDGYAEWRNNQNWPPDSTAKMQDPDGDGLINYLEFLFDLDPTFVDARSLTTLITETTPTSRLLRLDYRQNTGGPDLSNRIEFSTDLVQWRNAVAEGLLLTVETLDSDPDGDGSAFLLRSNLVIDKETARAFLRIN